MARTIQVRAAEGMSIPLLPGQAINSGVNTLTPETTVEVFFNRYARRRIAAGDWIRVDDDKPGADELPTVDLEPTETYRPASPGDVERLVRGPRPAPPRQDDDGEES